MDRHPMLSKVCKILDRCEDEDDAEDLMIDVKNEIAARMYSSRVQTAFEEIIEDMDVDVFGAQESSSIQKGIIKLLKNVDVLLHKHNYDKLCYYREISCTHTMVNIRTGAGRKDVFLNMESYYDTENGFCEDYVVHYHIGEEGESSTLLEASRCSEGNSHVMYRGAMSRLLDAMGVKFSPIVLLRILLVLLRSECDECIGNKWSLMMSPDEEFFPLGEYVLSLTEEIMVDGTNDDGDASKKRKKNKELDHEKRVKLS